MNTIILALTAGISLFISYFIGKKLIPYLKKLKFNQTIYQEGPYWHKTKENTPTMGGFIIIGGCIIGGIIGLILISAFVSEDIDSRHIIKTIMSLVMALCFAFVGFLDDYVKVVKKQNLGLMARQKILLQVIITVGYLCTLYLSGTNSTILTIPFLGQIQLGAFYYILMGILIIGIVNAVNLTDGIDGLAAGVTFVFSLVFLVIASIINNLPIQIISMSLAGSLLGFLIYNINPAKIFMGDTGSMFLGGLVVAFGFSIDNPLIIIVVGIIYCIEALSVILQIISFKLTKKRIFKMSPIHHHFEMCNWSEIKIVSVFCIVTAIFGIIAIFLVQSNY